MPEQSEYPQEDSLKRPESFEVDPHDDPDFEWVKDLVEKGIPTNIMNTYWALKHLAGIVIDPYIAQEVEAQPHVEIAKKLFEASYRESIESIVITANRIITTYPGSLTSNGLAVTHVTAEWDHTGEAHLHFHTDA